MVCLITDVLHRMDGPADRSSAWKVVRGQLLAGAGVVLLFALPLVRIFINSGTDFNDPGLSSMPLTLAEGAARSRGQRGRSSRRGSARSGRSSPAPTRSAT